VLSSKDMGLNWSSPVQVNDDHTQADQNTPTLAVNNDGTLGISWYDRRNDPKDNCFQEYFSASVDGGLTFLPNVAVQEHPTCTIQPGNWQSNVSQSHDVPRGTYNVVLSSPGLRFMNAGETQGMASLGDRRFQLGWINGESGVMQLSSTIVKVSASALGLDVGEFLEVRTTAPGMDLMEKTVSMQVVVTNRSRRALALPLAIELTRVDSIFDGLKVRNSDNRLPGVGAVWNLASSSPDKTVLRPKEASAPLVLRFGFEKVPEEKLPDVGSAAPLDIDFHIFESQH